MLDQNSSATSKNSPFIEKMTKFFMKDSTFIILYIVLCAGVVGGTHLYLTSGTGIFLEAGVGTMLSMAQETGDFGAVIGLAGGFLLARILEGPLVGLLDIGGSTMAGVGLGVCGLILSFGYQSLLYNFPLALITGALIGLILGCVIMGIRKLIPEGVTAGGTDIMMGVGHQLGTFFAPLLILAAMSVSIPLGICALIGSVVFYVLDKGVVGGSLIGMLIGAFIFTIAVTGVTLNTTEAVVGTGAEKQIAATIEPKSATVTDITWASDNTAVATVDKDGKITGVQPGKAVITVTTKDGSHTATCDVTVIQTSAASSGGDSTASKQ